MQRCPVRCEVRRWNNATHCLDLRGAHSLPFPRRRCRRAVAAVHLRIPLRIGGGGGRGGTFAAKQRLRGLQCRDGLAHVAAAEKLFKNSIIADDRRKESVEGQASVSKQRVKEKNKTQEQTALTSRAGWPRARQVQATHSPPLQ